MTSTAWKYVNILKTICPYGNRKVSTSPNKNYTLLNIDNKTGVATITMNRPPINALNVDLLLAIRTDLEQVEKSNCRGLILTSSLRSVFCAGLDITQLHNPDKDRLRALWSAMQDVALFLNTQSTPVVSLINGHAPAGGCVLATSTEYRIMLPNYTIGLNEPALGLVPPKWIMDTFLGALPRRIAESALVRGRLFLTEDAYNVGLVDEIVNDKEEGLVRCGRFIDRFNGVNPVARALTKKQFRVNDLSHNKKEDLDWFVGYIVQPDIQKAIGAYLDSLKNKPKN